MNTLVASRAALVLLSALFFAACSSSDCPSGSNADSLFCHRADASSSDARDGSIDAGCRSDTDCPMGLHCDPTSHACVACVTDAQCGAGMRCDTTTHQCVMGCGPGTMCPTGEMCCSGTCADTQTSASNCGMCGHTCTGGGGVAGACVASSCRLACPSGRADCDGVASTGCEVDLTTDPRHCGACATTCTAAANATATCMGGTCSFMCMAGFADCNHVASDGCEVNTNTDTANCGMCGHSCAPGICDGTGSCRACTPGMSCSSGPVCQHTGTISCTPTGPVCGNFVNDPPGTGCGAGMVCDGAGSCIICMQNASCVPATAPCDSGRTDCSTGAVVCTDTGHLPAGTSCGTDMVCDGAGHCNACTPGPCTIPTDPCHTAMVDCSSGAPVCTVSGNTAAGTSCGTNHVCDGAGSCVLCATGMACNPGGDLCQTGTLSCSTGAPVCTPTGNSPAGTICGTGMVCDGADHCVMCEGGMSCNPGGNACITGAVGCSTGAPVCGATGFAPGGTSCGLGRVCDGAGNCIVCNMGAACPIPSHPCEIGATSCTTGTPQCNVAGNVAAGTSCGANQVCDGSGNCIMCQTGMSCAPGGNTCETGSIACSTGAPVCNMTGNVAAGTSCGSQMVCNGAGMCVTCRAGMACAPGGNVCLTGSITCGTGAEVCTTTGDVAAGTSCGTNHVCDGAGNCMMCTAGVACNPAGNLCVNGTTSCSTGAQVCNATTNVAAGTTCGMNQVCDGSGHCIPCTMNAPCNPGGNVCVNGTTSCTSGAPVCNATTNVAAGTSCGTNHVCNGAGNCVSCTMNMACNPGGNLCVAGAINCSSGGPVCATTGYEPYLTSCGAGQYCDGAGTCCQPGWGTYGNTNETWTAPGQQWQFESSWCTPSAPPGCYGGLNVNYFQLVTYSCTAPGSGGSCTDPDATYTVTCLANVQCQYDCSGSCNPTSC